MCPFFLRFFFVDRKALEEQLAEDSDDGWFLFCFVLMLCVDDVSRCRGRLG
jgi:hypothetical protein